MASDFSINALLDLPTEERQESTQINKAHEKLKYGGTGFSGLGQPQSYGEQANVSRSPPRVDLTVNGSTKLLNHSSCLESRLPPEFTTIVMPRKDSKPRRKRTAFSNIQLYFLEQFFQKKAYPSSHERNFIASILNIGTGQVKTWFQNRRTKWKKSNYAGFEKQTFVDTTFHGTNPPWPIHNQGLWLPGFPSSAMASSNGQVPYF